MIISKGRGDTHVVIESATQKPLNDVIILQPFVDENDALMLGYLTASDDNDELKILIDEVTAHWEMVHERMKDDN